MLGYISLEIADFGVIYKLIQLAQESIEAERHENAAAYLSTAIGYMRNLADEADAKARAV